MYTDSVMPVRLVGSVAEAAPLLAAFGRKCMIVTGGSSAARSGALADVQAVLTANGIQSAVFDRVEPNPLTGTCREAGAIARAFGAEFLIGIGGGSAMDAAKAVAFYAADASLAANDIYTRRAATLPVVLVGTTAGTGSEVTGVSVLTNDENGRKKSISGADCYAKIAVCNYRYTMTMPYALTVSTALDAFAHATESLFSSQATEESVFHANRALPLIWQGLCALRQSEQLPDESLRRRLYQGSLYAGMAINITGTLFPHTVGYVLTEKRNVPHGVACAAFAPILFARCAEYLPQRLAAAEQLLQTDRVSILRVVSELADLRVSFSAEEARRIAAVWQGVDIRNFTRSPGGFDASDGEAALKSLGERL